MTVWPSIYYRFQTLLDITRQARMQLVWKTTSLFRVSRGQKKNKRFVRKNVILTVHIAFLNLSSYINPMIILASLF